MGWLYGRFTIYSAKHAEYKDESCDQPLIPFLFPVILTILKKLTTPMILTSEQKSNRKEKRTSNENLFHVSTINNIFKHHFSWWWLRISFPDLVCSFSCFFLFLSSGSNRCAKILFLSCFPIFTTFIFYIFNNLFLFSF